MAEREGFEPSGPLSQAAFLAGMWFKPNSPTSPGGFILLIWPLNEKFAQEFSVPFPGRTEPRGWVLFDESAKKPSRRHHVVADSSNLTACPVDHARITRHEGAYPSSHPEEDKWQFTWSLVDCQSNHPVNTCANYLALARAMPTESARWPLGR